MSWIPLVFGSTAVFGGGYLSDRLARRRGVKGRLLVLIFCCVSGGSYFLVHIHNQLTYEVDLCMTYSTSELRIHVGQDAINCMD